MADQQSRISLKIDGLKDAVRSLVDARKAVEELRKRGVELNAKLDGADFGAEQVAELTAELERAGVAYETLASDIEGATQAAADLNNEAGATVNTLAALEQRAAELGEELKGLEIGSAAFNKVKAEIEATNQRLASATVSAEEAGAAFRDLAAKSAGTFAIGAGLAASFAADNEDAAAAVALIGQAIAAAELIRNAAETAEAARKVELVEKEQEYAAALSGTNEAQQGQVQGFQGSAKAGRGFGGVLTNIGRIIKANPILLLASALTAIVTGVIALSSRFKFLAQIVEAVEDATGGVVQVFKDLSKNIGAVGDIITSSFTVAIEGANVALQGFIGGVKSLLGFDNPFEAYDAAAQDLSKSLDDVATSFTAVTDAYARGVERTRAIRRNEQAIALKEVADTAARISEAELGSVRATEDARRGIRLKGLQEDRKLLRERLALQADLSEEEVRILEKGTAQQIAALRKVVDERGQVDAEVLANLQAFEQAQTALLAEQEAARLAAIQDRVRAVDDTLAIEQARLANVENFVNRGLELEARYNAERQKLTLQRQAGEFKSAQEFNNALALLDQNRLNEQQALSREVAEFNLELTRQAAEGEAATLERTLEEGRRLRTLDFDEQVSLINRTRDARIAALDAETQTLDARRDEDRKRLQEIAAERIALDREVADAVRETAVAAAQQAADAETARLAIAQQLLDVTKQRGDIEKQVSDNDLAKAQEALDRQAASTANLTNATEDYEARLRLINDVQQANAAEIERQKQLTLESLALQEQQVQAQLALNQAKLDAGEIGEAEAEQARKALEAQLELLKAQGEAAEVTATVQLDVNEREAESQAKAALNDYASFLSGYLKGPVAAEVSQALNDAFGAFGPVINELAGAVANQALELVATIQAAQLAAIDEDITATEQRISEAQALLAETEAAAQESSTRIQELTAEALRATGEQQAAIIAQIDAERVKRDELAASQKKQAADERALVQQQIALDKKRADLEAKQRKQQKIIQIASAIANGALATVKAIAEVPFPASIVVAALYAALTAGQVATIAAQPARDGGFLTPRGGLVQMRAGGLLKGPSHEAGGIRGTGTFAGIEVEGGEAIIPKAAVANNRGLVERLIEDGPMRKLRDGAVFPSAALADTASADARARAESAALVGSINALASRPVRVGVVDIAEGQQRVGVIDDVSSV